MNFRGAIPGEPEAALALAPLRLGPNERAAVGDGACDTLLLVHAGSGTLDGVPFAAVSSLHVAAGRTAELTAGHRGLEAVMCTIGSAVDLHAPFGPAAAIVAAESAQQGTATGARSFQVLHGPANGSTRATAFIGFIPPGKAPRHYHLYDEIVWVLAGEGRLHLEGEPEPLAPGSAFRLHPRERHIVENTSAGDPLTVVGFFTPAGSPSAAYLDPDVAAAYHLARSVPAEREMRATRTVPPRSDGR